MSQIKSPRNRINLRQLAQTNLLDAFNVKKPNADDQMSLL
jgi:hypothetical protein